MFISPGMESEIRFPTLALLRCGSVGGWWLVADQLNKNKTYFCWQVDGQYSSYMYTPIITFLERWSLFISSSTDTKAGADENEQMNYPPIRNNLSHSIYCLRKSPLTENYDD